MKNFGIYLLLLSFASLMFSMAIEKNQITNIDDSNFIQNSLEEKVSSELEENYCRGNCPSYGNFQRENYSFGKNYGYNCEPFSSYRRKGIRPYYLARNKYSDCDKGFKGKRKYFDGSFRGNCYYPYPHHSYSNTNYPYNGRDGCYGYPYNYPYHYDNYDDDFCASGPSYENQCYNGRGHFTKRKDLRGKYITLEDAAALLGRERARCLAANKASKNTGSNKCENSGSNYINKECDFDKKCNKENCFNNHDSNIGKIYQKRKCNSADRAACDRDHQHFLKKSHDKLNCRNGKKEALCMNSNKLNKNFSDGDLLEEFDKLEHFKKCARGHKENLTGNDYTVKKSHKFHNSKDKHSLACHKDRKRKANNQRASSDSKERIDYEDHDLRNKNSIYNKAGKECNLENDVTKAGKYENEKENECKRQNSKEIALAKKNKMLKKIKNKEVKGGCLDKSKCIDAGVCKEASNENVSSPIC